MTRFWVSWYQTTEDYRPISYPPNENVLAWWCTGQSDSGATLCAVVAAPDEHHAMKAIQTDWPEMNEWRFCDVKDPDWAPRSDRFPLKDWQVERLAGDKEGLW